MNPIQSITSTTIDASTQTKSFDELVKEHVQENLPKDIFELPEEAYDPVTREEIQTPFITACGHMFDKDTLISIGKTSIDNENNIECPLCRKKIKWKAFYYARSVKNIINTIKQKIQAFRF